jgi:hypothetical protein
LKAGTAEGGHGRRRAWPKAGTAEGGPKQADGRSWIQVDGTAPGVIICGASQKYFAAAGGRRRTTSGTCDAIRRPAHKQLSHRPAGTITIRSCVSFTRKPQNVRNPDLAEFNPDEMGGRKQPTHLT